MKTKLLLVAFLMCNSVVAFCQQDLKTDTLESGVSYNLATARRQEISDVAYEIFLRIPETKKDSIVSSNTISFKLKTNKGPLYIDYKQPPESIRSVTVNGVSVPVTVLHEHLIIDARYLHTGANAVSIAFLAGDASLNRNNEYLYALLVPDRARTAFPCFDQPSLKATFSLTLSVPSDWKVLANADIMDSSVGISDRTTYSFQKSDKLPTYLFSFTAGKYNSVNRMIGKRNAEFLYRETDTSKIAVSLDSIFAAHADAISFLENWTGIPFPFQKIGFVAIPDFQFGGMEHPGVVEYKASALFLHKGATKEELIARSNLISHETAHMWFGDLVTMQWFNDVWMKEVFANFMADKITQKVMGTETFNQKFLIDHYPAAYGVDRTLGANPIRQELSNLQDAGSLYGNIIYHKAPIVMRQLELLMGEDNFRKGIREYLKTYAYANATWPDLISILGKYTTKDLKKWNEVWVNQTGRPVFTYALQGNKLVIEQHAEIGQDRVWPQAFSVTLVYRDHNTVLPVQSATTRTEIALHGKPGAILFNTDGKGYGLFPVDTTMNSRIFNITDPLQRAALYVNDYENMLAGRSYDAQSLLKLFAQGLQTEKNEMDLRLLSGYITGIYWSFIPEKNRPAFTTLLEAALWTAIEQQQLPNNKKILFKAYQDIYLSDNAKSRIYEIWSTKTAPEKVALNEDDYTSLALTIALKSDTATHVIATQMERVADPDRKQRLAFIQPALSPDSSVRDLFFASLSKKQNRQKEAWVNAALYYLHHPLRQNVSVKYLKQSLDILEELQRTGDIFFPQSWLGATFGSYQSATAYKVVTDFLSVHPNYNPKLKNKILQATDNLRRAQMLVH